MTKKRAGLLIRIDGALFFVPATIALRVAPPPRVTSVPGAPPDLLGIAVSAGAVVPVIAIGGERAEMVICQHAGELVGVVGGRVVQSGSFDVTSQRPDVVTHEGETAPTLDVPAIYARIQAGGRT
jgi:chemotaxis signal transduction protein